MIASHFRAALFGSATLLLTLGGCDSKVAVLTPEVQAGMMNDLQAGKLTLDCGFKCDFTWNDQVAQIHALDMSERWNDLAVHVMQIGYGNDLAYYYLGQAAQGLGYHQSAISYYNYAFALSNGTDVTLKCEGTDSCQGVDLASSIPVLVKASQDALAAQEAANAPAPPVHHHHRAKPQPAQWAAPPPPNASAPATGSGGSGWAPPPPAAN